MIFKNTIEEKIIEIQQRKKQLAEDLVSEDEGFVKSLTEEDIAYLFS
jgi:SNF2 family DNA or RNA helicase